MVHLAVGARLTGDRQFKINPLYTVVRDGSQVRLTLAFPNPDYADEYGACLQYLPETIAIDAAPSIRASPVA